MSVLQGCGATCKAVEAELEFIEVVGGKGTLDTRHPWRIVVPVAAAFADNPPRLANPTYGAWLSQVDTPESSFVHLQAVKEKRRKPFYLLRFPAFSSSAP